MAIDNIDDLFSVRTKSLVEGADQHDPTRVGLGSSRVNELYALALRARSLFAGAVSEAMSEFATTPGYFDLETASDREGFLKAVQVGGILALSELSDTEAHHDFFRTLLYGEGSETTGEQGS